MKAPCSLWSEAAAVLQVVRIFGDIPIPVNRHGSPFWRRIMAWGGRNRSPLAAERGRVRMQGAGIPPMLTIVLFVGCLLGQDDPGRQVSELVEQFRSDRIE